MNFEDSITIASHPLSKLPLAIGEFIIDVINMYNSFIDS